MKLPSACVSRFFERLSKCIGAVAKGSSSLVAKFKLETCVAIELNGWKIKAGNKVQDDNDDKSVIK